MMDIIKPELFHFVKKGSAVLMLCLFAACVQNSNVQHQKVDEDVEPSKNYAYGDELPCKPDTGSYPIQNNRLFEDILEVYIDTEKLSAKEDFISISSSCWTDSTYIVIMEHYKWNNSADSLIYLEKGKVSSYRGIDIYLDVTQTKNFPIPTQLAITDKMVVNRVKEPYSPFNEYFNDVHVEYYPKEDRVLNVLGTSDIAFLYQSLFRKKGLLK